MPRIDTFTSGSPLDRLGINHTVKVVSGPRTFGPTVGMVIPVRTPDGDVLMHPYCPSYYNPPLAYDRCSPPRPFDRCDRPSRVPSVALNTCDCGNPGTCSGEGHSLGGCSCQSGSGRLVKDVKPSTNRGYFGEHHIDDAGYDWQFGYNAGETVFGPKAKGDNLTPKERELALKLLEGDFDSLVTYLQDKGAISERADKPDVSGVAPPREPRQIDAAPVSVPRAYVLIHRGAVQPTSELARLINLRLGAFFDICQRSCACKRPMTYNPYGSVNGLRAVRSVGAPPETEAEAKLSGEQVVALSDVMMVEEGFNPAKNPKLRKIYAAALIKELSKEGLTVKGYPDGSWLVEGPPMTTDGLFDFVKKAVKSVGNAVKSAAKAVKKTVIDPVSGFVKKAGSTITGGLKSIDKKLGITKGLKSFAKGAGKFLGDSWPMLAGAALTAVTGGAAAPLLGVLGGGLGGGSGLGAIGQAASSLLGGSGGGIGDVLGKLAGGLGGGGGIGGALSSILGSGSGGIASVLGGVLGSGGGSLLQNLGGQITQAAQQAPQVVDPVAALLGGQTGILGALGGNLGKLGGGALNVLSGIGQQAIKPTGFDFASLLSNLQGLSQTSGSGSLGGLLAADVPQQVRSLLAAQLARGGGVAGAVVRARALSGSVGGQYTAQAVAGVLASLGETPHRAWSVGTHCAASAPTIPTVSGGPSSPGAFGDHLLVGVVREVCAARGERRFAA